MSYEWVNKKTRGLGTKASVNWGDQRMNWGLRTKASSNWLDQRVNRKFRYQGINTLIRPTNKPKVEGLMIISWRAQGPQWEHKAHSGSTRPRSRLASTRLTVEAQGPKNQQDLQFKEHKAHKESLS
jgi:hypothetical protein